MRNAAWKREIIKDGEVSPALHSTITELLAFYLPDAMKLSTDGTTFVNRKLAFAFEHALVANLQAWKLFLNAIGQIADSGTPGCYITLTEDIRQAFISWSSSMFNGLSMLANIFEHGSVQSAANSGSSIIFKNKEIASGDRLSGDFPLIYRRDQRNVVPAHPQLSTLPVFTRGRNHRAALRRPFDWRADMR